MKMMFGCGFFFALARPGALANPSETAAPATKTRRVVLTPVAMISPHIFYVSAQTGMRTRVAGHLIVDGLIRGHFLSLRRPAQIEIVRPPSDSIIAPVT
ncbi:hypothetical protein ACFQGS_21745 [Novosphingobium lubricantis]